VSTTSTGSLSRGSRRREASSVPDRPRTVDEALQRLGIRPSRALGQSFLVDRFVADALAALAEPASGRAVVEVGGGLGIVTRALLERGVRDLTVVERDRRLARHLEATFGPRVAVRCADARAFEFPPGATVVGSLPYASATSIVLGLLHRRVPRVAVLLQKEVAERFAATPRTKAYGRPSIVARLYGEPELLREVGPEAFYPVPRVASRLWTHTARDGPLPVPSVSRLEGVVRRLFGARRKQLGNLLPQLASGRAGADELARSSGWPEGWTHLRPEQLEPEAFFRLATVLEPRGGRASGTPGAGPAPTA
jgi:16S rRNA (adenine1518-N6/adenine1519-N6)-dimethyltransferase